MSVSMNHPFDYHVAFSRNIGWVTPEEQELLRGKRVAVGGLGGVGGSHLVVLARLGVSCFNISDLDTFEVGNFNRQMGATMSTVGHSKIDVLADTVRDINPEADIRTFPEGISRDNLDGFLEDVDVYVDSLDIFTIDIRRKVFAKCYEKGIPAVTAAPLGLGTALLVFMPGKMSFEDYFCLEGLDIEEQVLSFIVGVAPAPIMRSYLVVPTSINTSDRKAPSTAMGIELAAGVACSNVMKLLLGRGDVICAPRGLHFDAYRNKLVRTWRPWGNRNPLQKLRLWTLKRFIQHSDRGT